ncbi:hypothetical protein [Streptomyces cucumeris]|uniref:hypothetical protein n=1 Tax=Streptomyces cucumeris TaxID=2962890 RepID=UPI003D73FEA4
MLLLGWFGLGDPGEVGLRTGDLTGPDKEHAETSTLAPHLLQSALAHPSTLLVQQVLAEPARAKKLSDEDRRHGGTS